MSAEGLNPVTRFAELPDLNLGPIIVREVFENDAMSFAIVAVKGTNVRTINHGSNTVYHVASGDGFFRIGDQVLRVIAGDTVTIPAGTPYQDAGTMVLHVICTPPFDRNMVEVLG
jgi:mannose-6-phosphate isomerase-like protein (cupin superfamily)